MSKNITLLGASYTAVPAVVLPVTGGGSARFDDTSDADATAADIANGKTAYVNGQKVTGSAIVADVTWETLANQNVTVVADNPNYFVITNYTEPFASGETYRITWGQGGTQYVCQTIQDETGASYDGYIIGNPGVVGRTPDTGEPFIIYRDRSNRLACATNQAAGTLHVTIERMDLATDEAVLTDKTITENGTYDPADDNADGYSSVTVSVQSEVNIDSKTATASSYPVQLAFTGLKGEPKAFFLKSTSQISSSGSTAYYYIIAMRYNGTNTTGSCFRIGSTRRVDNITSGYSFTYSNGTLTLRSSASSRSASPGAFNNTYELVYIY